MCWRVRIPLRWVQKRKAPIAGSLSNQWWAMRDVACGFAARSRFGPTALACCAGKRLRVSSAPHPVGFESLCDGPEKRKASIAGGLTIQWWAMRDVRVRLRRPHPLRRFAPRVLRWKTLRVSSAPHLCGFESHEMGPNKNGPLSRTVSNSMVGDEGFEPPALCV